MQSNNFDKIQDGEPKVINCQNGEKEIYDRLKEDAEIFKNADLKDIFLLAMVKGFREGNRNKIKQYHQGGLFRLEFLKDEEKNLIKAIAVTTVGKLDILINKREVYKIAEEYASGGIRLLEKEIFGSEFGNEFGSFKKRLANKLTEELKKFTKTGI